MKLPFRGRSNLSLFDFNNKIVNGGLLMLFDNGFDNSFELVCLLRYI